MTSCDDQNKGYEFRHDVTSANVGGERVLYLKFSYPGCTQDPHCAFCPFGEGADTSITPDEEYGELVFDLVRDSLRESSADALVLYDGGNILRAAEMYQPTILQKIPELVAADPVCKALEVEVRADDVVAFQRELSAMKESLSGKELRVRVGMEYGSDELLTRHQKGLTVEQMFSAFDTLNQLGIRWNGYSMLGGLDMTRDDALKSVIQSSRCMMDRGAFKISINGIFVTGMMDSNYGDRVYVPTIDDLKYVLSELSGYKWWVNSSAIFKVGSAEEELGDVVRFPYAKDGNETRILNRSFNSFNDTQDLRVILDL